MKRNHTVIGRGHASASTYAPVRESGERAGVTHVRFVRGMGSASVELAVDVDAVLRAMGARAVRSRRGLATMLGGAVVPSAGVSSSDSSSTPLRLQAYASCCSRYRVRGWVWAHPRARRRRLARSPRSSCSALCARLNCIRHLLSLIPYEDLTPEPIALPPRQSDNSYVRPPITDQTFVPEVYVLESKAADNKA